MSRLVTVVILLAFSAVIGCGTAQRPITGKTPDDWLGALRDPDPRLRKKAVAKLGNAGPLKPDIFPALVQALGDADAQVRSTAIVALVKFGDQALAARPTLENLHQQDADPQVRAYAAKAIQKFQRRATEN